GQAESVLAYAAVADLLGDVDPDVLDELPDLQRIAVDRVLLRTSSEGPATDHRVVAAAFATVLDRLSIEVPTVVAMDDVQWMDPCSQAVVSYAARRLNGRVGVLVTERCDPDCGHAVNWLHLARPDGIDRIHVGPLSLGGLHALISSRLGRSFSRPAMVQIAETSGGNPFYALELARAIDDGTAGSRQVLPATLCDLMRQRIGSLNRDACALLLAAASVANPTVQLLADVTYNTIDRAVELLGEAERKGLITFDGDNVRFAHPLLARSVYTDASPAERRAMHRKLAQAVVLPELKARHMALAASSADPATLSSLDKAADSANARGAPAAAAELVELAIGLGGDTPQRRIRAAEHHFMAGDATLARRMLEPTIDQLEPGLLRGIALNLMAGVLLYEDNWNEAVTVLEGALDDARDDPTLLTHTLISLAFSQRMVAKFDESLTNARKAVAAAEDLGVPTLISRALAMLVQLSFIYGHGVDESSLQRALDLDDPDVNVLMPFRARVVLAEILSWTGRLDEARVELEAARRSAVERGAEHDLMAIATLGTLVEVWGGNFAEATLLADEVMERAEQGGGSLSVAFSMKAMAAAYVGREHDAREGARAALEIAARGESPRLANWPLVTLGFLEVSLGNYSEAVATLQPLVSAFETSPGLEIMTASYIPDAVEAMVALGRRADAEPMIKALETDGRHFDRPWMLAIGARCRSMYLAAEGDVDAASLMAQQAIREHDRLQMPFERARTQLLLGQLQRRQRQKVSATTTLNEAMRAFVTLGAPLWADRARAELARVNVSPTRDLALTPSERRVAELAASGMTNRDVAAALFISPKTVEANLARIYRKLGINSRAELGRIVADQR
ncbi:helix-turn-helix transcriptional regulator, partial [Mycobacterium sp.]|uniref:helix-turn-helix transcriptional regulator n=1 Tax=Mycobacterium sp. TaxID=1785 RepID=UPI002D9706E4|nr:LuxR C-terminal-related transcriptional regulator [Mycobacterium sp.]